MTQARFVHDFAIAHMAPGPGSLLATLIGWQVAGPLSALAASAGIFGPTAFLIYGIARLWRRHQRARRQKQMEAGLRPVAAGLILAAVYVLMHALAGGWLARGIALAATVLLMRTKMNPLLVLGCGAAVLTVARLAASS